MAICCWFNSAKKYAYQVGSFCGDWKVERVIVKECMVCGNKTIVTPSYTSKEREVYICRTIAEVETMAELNGIPLLNELE